MEIDPRHPDTRHLMQVVAEIWTGYVRAHSLAECQEVARRTDEQRQVRRRLFGGPVHINSENDRGKGSF